MGRMGSDPFARVKDGRLAIGEGRGKADDLIPGQHSPTSSAASQPQNAPEGRQKDASRQRAV